MGALRYSSAMSLDGFLAGPDQSRDNPLGVGGQQLHEWLVELASWRAEHGLDGGVENESTAVLAKAGENLGGILMGRNMFGGGPGPWSTDEPWNGWWGDTPPFHLPVFVLTHHPRPPLELDGTTFTFVTEGIGAALDLARAVAGDRDVAVAGGAGTARQYLDAGLLDELTIHLVPVLLGGGVRLFEPGVTEPRLEQVGAVAAPGVTHLTYRPIR